jgi:hypothetical protein
MGRAGWLVIERSRDAKKPSDTKYNYGANTAYLKKYFNRRIVSVILNKDPTNFSNWFSHLQTKNQIKKIKSSII